jgi:hypothetical protein
VAACDSAEGRPALPESLSEVLRYLEAVHELVDWAPDSLVPARETIIGLTQVRYCQTEKLLDIKKIRD